MKPSHRHRMALILAVGVAIVGTAMTGCVSAETLGPKPTTGVWGYVASTKNAALEIDASRSGVSGVVASRVLAPVDGFVVATQSGEGTTVAMQVGYSSVKRGESTDIVVPILRVKSDVITVTLYADKGKKGRFESDPMDATASPDRPIFVDGQPVATSVTISRPTEPLGSGAAVLDVFDQPVAKRLNVTHVAVSRPSWIVVYADDNGSPGRERGRRSITATDAVAVKVPLTGRPGKLGEFVSLNIDAGSVGALEYSRRLGSKGAGPDTPYVVNGDEVLRHIVLQK